MILLWGSMEDEPLSMARAALERAGADFLFLDHRRIFASEIDWDCGAGTGGRCTVTQGGAEIDLSGVRAAYVRGSSFFDYEEMQDRPLGDPLAIKASGFEGQLMAFLDASDALVINRSDPSATNNSKPYQLTVIRQAGLGIPETFVTNDSRAVRRFLSANPDCIYKSISGIRSIVRRVSDAQRGFMDDVGWCPTLFQRVVPGTNYRAHVVGEEVLAVRLESNELDYRYGSTTMVAAELPADVAAKCRRLSSMLGLHFSGIDLMRTPQDEWYCFEVNTSPGYSYFERGSGQPISAALARIMIDADRRPEGR
jgi:glutathione synthase/RimK-type ligase-like ATP-grasp enzyme